MRKLLLIGIHADALEATHARLEQALASLAVIRVETVEDAAWALRDHWHDDVLLDLTTIQNGDFDRISEVLKAADGRRVVVVHNGVKSAVMRAFSIRWGADRVAIDAIVEDGLEALRAASNFDDGGGVDGRRLLGILLENAQQGYLILYQPDRAANKGDSGAYQVLYANTACDSLLGVPSRLLLGHDLLTSIGESEASILSGALRKAAREQTALQVVEACHSPAGPRWLGISVKPFGEEWGEGYLLVGLHDATERIKLRGTAEFLGNELESLNQIYDEMLAALSYQMRTPLNNVLGFTELIESELFGPLPNEQYRGYVRDISKSGRLMLNTLDGLLDRGRFNVLKRQEAGYRHIIELAPDMMLICRENHIVFINPAGISLLGIESADEVVGKSFETFVHPDFKDVVAAGLTPLTRRHGRVPLMLKKADGRDIEIEVSALDYQEPNEAPGIMLVARDLTEINRAARIANDREERLQRVVDTVADGIITLDENGIVQTVNRAACRILRDQANDIIGQSFAPFLDTDVGSLIRLLDARLSEGNVHSTGTERRFKRGDGEAGYIDLAVSKLVLEDGKNLYIAVIRDVTERKQSEEKLRYLATRDHLTGLPNYALFLERLEVAISISAETESIIGILFVDLDHFKNINDTLGHTAGDQVLRMAGDRLLACVDESDTVSRLGADEYMILLETIDSTDEAARIAQKVCSSLSTPFEVNGRQVYTSASIGVALYPTHAESTSELVKHVDTATHHAKHLGRNNIQFYTEELSRKMLRHLELESGLREALNRNEFTVYYQPQVSLVSRQVVGAEALIRWHSAELGQVSPAEFIPVAEATGLIAAIGEWVLREACMQLAAWRRAGWDDMTISVNISARQFHQSDLAERIAQILEETGAPAEYLDLELTEGVLIEDAEETLHILAPLKEMGISVSVDDFGTGYSSLNYLKRFPIDTLKIDRSFIKDIPTDADDMAITRAIVTLANTLDLKTVAEGVESEDQLVFLSALGCTLSQGYLTGKPVPAAAFTRRLVDQKNPVAKRG